LLDGSVDLADIARMNDWIDVKADNDMRIERWERETVNAEIMKSFLISLGSILMARVPRNLMPPLRE
jgi:hypothetical protein